MVKSIKMTSLNRDMSSISVSVSFVSGEQGMQPHTFSWISESGLSISKEEPLMPPKPSALVWRESLLVDLWRHNVRVRHIQKTLDKNYFLKEEKKSLPQ